jgi:acetate---CoA ligase (ADP-forming)
MGLETALAAIRAAQSPAGQAGWCNWVPLARQRPLALLAEDAAKALLDAGGIATPRGVSAASLAELTQAAGHLAAPLVLKGLGFAHKTEAGAVRLHLATLDGQEEMDGAAGYLAEEMVTGSLAELLLGVRRDPVYGATLTVGFGGVMAELLDDTVTMVMPVTAEQITDALHRLRLWPLLAGYRGGPPADVGAVIAVALALQSLLETDRMIEEIEINPLMVRTQGAVAVDAVIWKETP